MIKLRDYQEKIINELKYLPASALYMGTGTGKTITSLELLKNFPVDNLLVVCPHNAKTQWKDNIKTHFGYDVVELNKYWTSKQINAYLATLEYSNTAIVINYDMISRIPVLKGIVNNKWAIILDEMHRIKNMGTKKKPVKTTEYMLQIANKTPYKIGLTATPTQGNYGGYIDYFTQLKFLGYTDLNYDEYYNRYVTYEKKNVGGLPFPIKVITGYKNKNEIDDILVTIARRYVPKYKDFEPQFNKVILERPKGYTKLIKEKAYEDLAFNNTSRARIGKKTFTSGVISGKTMLRENKYYLHNTVKVDWLSEFLDDADSPVVVLYNYNVELDTLIQMARKKNLPYIVINGATKDKGEEIKKDFKVLFGQYKAISEALDGLQYKSNIMVMFSMPEDAILYKQALGRIDRIGQEKVPMYYFLIMEKTIDEAIMELVESKVEFSEETLNLLEV